jgi:hypothetical protein
MRLIRQRANVRCCLCEPHTFFFCCFYLHALRPRAACLTSPRARRSPQWERRPSAGSPHSINVAAQFAGSGQCAADLEPPLKTIETTDSVQEEVTRAFRDALQRRGLLVGPGDGATDLAVIIRRLDCSQYVRREAHADFRVLLTDRQGRPLYQDDVQATVVDGSRLALDVGIFGDPDALRSMAIEVMSTAIDQALDKPGFRAAFASDHPSQ